MRATWKRAAGGAAAAVLAASFAAPAFAGWIWTPESGRWVNPRNQPKESASLQFQYAEELLEQEKYEDAIREFERVLTHFPTSSYGDLAQFSIGRAYEAAGEWDAAAEAYQDTIEEYPNTRLFDRVITKQYELANKYYERAIEKDKEKHLLPNFREVFTDRDDFDRAIDVYQTVVDNQPFTESAAEAQYRIGLCHVKQEEYDLAIVAYETVLELYPGSPWAGEAAFGAAQAEFDQSLPAVYDQTAVQEATERLETYLRRYDDPERQEQVQQMLRDLADHRAEHEFLIAEWYHRQQRFDSARLYYEQVIKAHPETQWAEQSKHQLTLLP